mmetsp:Transcript_29849/g.80827  ORF Transcript_29849/g.80827 Transcript_29849/m.80827 type:complete len:264 (-) Transcript_29849:88-879(-)
MPSMPRDPRLYREVVEAWLGPKSISAGYDTGAMGEMGMEGLVSLNTSASLMNLANAQATKLRQAVQVFNLRSAEAQNVVGFLQADASHEALPYTIHVGPGFGNKKSVDSDGLKEGLLGNLKTGKKTVGGVGASTGNNAGTSGSTRTKELIDLDGYEIKLALEEVIKFSRKAVRDAAYTQYLTSRGARLTNEAVRSTAEDLRYPGFPAEALPPRPSPRPPPSRPRNLAPAALDLQFASAPGTDPYKQWPDREVHNPFGYPPLSA